MSYLQENGFEVTVVYEADTASFKAEHQIPESMWSCHTAIFEDSGYFVEGHMPVVAIDQLFEDSPDIDGIALPGMPSGTPGMGGQPQGSLEIFAINDGQAYLRATIDATPTAE